MSDRPARPMGRDLGLDAFRGLTVVLMAIVNLQGDSGAAFLLLDHAAWNGLTLADLVFPWFILAVGLSTSLSFRSDHPPALSQVARRVAVLFAIGVVLGWLIRPTLDLNEIRWVGVLQRIALVYLVCVLVVRRSKGPVVPAAIAFACLVFHSLGLIFITAPGETSPSLAMGQGLSAWLDQVVLPGRLHRETWDPEGAWSTLSAIGTGLLGVTAARLSTGPRGNAVAMAAGIMLVAGLALIPLLPLNKALWTASFALVCSGSGLVLLMALKRLMATTGGLRFAAPAVFAGQTALTFFFLHMLLIAILVRKVSDETLWAAGFQVIQRLALPDPVSSLVFAILATALALAPVPWLRRRGWLIRA